jgi:excisionase family DNA binding protein
VADRIVIALSDGRWLARDREAFEAALVAGAELEPTKASSVATAGPRLLTSEQLSDQLNIPPTWLEEAARRDELPSVRIGKYVRFDLEEVLACLNPRTAAVRLQKSHRLR